MTKRTSSPRARSENKALQDFVSTVGDSHTLYTKALKVLSDLYEDSKVQLTVRVERMNAWSISIISQSGRADQSKVLLGLCAEIEAHPVMHDGP